MTLVLDMRNREWHCPNFVLDRDEVSTGSDSDRVSTHATVESARTVTQSLALPVLTSSFHTIRANSRQARAKVR
jgi:hypothetical protein